MKAFSPIFTVTLLSLSGLDAYAAVAAKAKAAPGASIAGAYTEMRLSPLFDGKVQTLARNWGPSLPIGTEFRVEKTYGRWLYGTPAPLEHMPEKEFAKPGWVFSRMLLLGGDQDTLPTSLVKFARGVIYHSREAGKKIAWHTQNLDFLESLTLSRGTLSAFSRQDESSLSGPRLPSLGIPSLAISEANAAEQEPEAPPSMGLSGTDLNFLDQEFKVLQEKKQAERRKQLLKKLKPPGAPALDEATRLAVLGRYSMQKYLEAPPLTHEEVDGFIYMRATAMRALEGCPAKVRDYWKNRRWNFFRVFRLKSRPEVRHPWLEVALPGGYFALSGRSIEVAGNESELAFLLVRPLVREMRLKRKKIAINNKEWPKAIEEKSEEVWEQTLKSQSTKDSENLDVADEIAVDIMATECISRGGYRPMGGLSYLRKMAASQEEPWAKWFIEHNIGLEYRLERLSTTLEESLTARKFPEGRATNPKRFATAARHWNLLP